MTVSVLRPAPGREALAALAAAREAVAEGCGVGAAVLSTAELAEAVEQLAALESQVAAWRLAVAAEADARGVAGRDAATGTDAWLARLTGDPREIMRGGLWLARLLQVKYAATRVALEQGTLRLAQAKVIVRAAERAPAGLSAEQVRQAEESLIACATGAGSRGGRAMDATRLRQQARRMFEVISPAVADEHEAAELAREERAAEAETYFMLHDNGDGTFGGRFVIPELHGRLLVAALDRLSSPRRLSRGRDGVVVDDSVPTGAPVMSRYEGHGAALCELVEHLPTTGHAGNAATLLIHLDYDMLVRQVGSARIDGGVRVSPGEARRLACEAGLVPVVLGGASVPLDLGREQRLHSTRQRQALSVRHEACAVEGCRRPFAWCEVHHRVSWASGGRTDLDNALPLCGFHHRRAHDDLFDLRRHANGAWRFHRRR